MSEPKDTIEEAMARFPSTPEDRALLRLIVRCGPQAGIISVKGRKGMTGVEAGKIEKYLNWLIYNYAVNQATIEDGDPPPMKNIDTFSR